MSTCNPNTLLASGAGFQALSKKDLQIAICQLLCNISSAPAGAAQSPWTGNIDAANFSLSNVNALVAATLAGNGALLTGIPESAVTNLVADLAAKSAGGYTIPLFSASSGSPLASTTYYIGGDPTAGQNVTYANTRVEVPKAGTIKRVFFKVRVGGTLSIGGGNVVHSIRINDTTDVASANATYDAVVSDGVVSSVSQAVVAGDYINWKILTPAWTTAPTTVKWYAMVYIE